MPAFSLLLTGCAAGPDYAKPFLEIPDQWIASPTDNKRIQASEKEPAGLAQWWSGFNDPVLSSLISRGIASNLDIATAVQRVRQSRAAASGANSGFWPSLDASASYRKSGTRLPSGSSETPAGATGSVSETRSLYQAGFDASWELDVFGSQRRGAEAAEAELQASQEDLHNALVTLSGDIGMNYINLRGLQEQLRITKENLKIQERSAQITRKRHEAGFASALDTAKAEAQLASTRAQIPSQESDIRKTIYAISLLLGQEPSGLITELEPYKPLPSWPDTIQTGLPSQLLERRPDIRAAEARLHAATARIGAAQADLFPRFFLNGSSGIQAAKLVSWSDSVTRLWSLGPSMSWNIFSGGATRARIEENKAIAEQALIDLRKTILVSLMEVESAWTAFDKEVERSISLSIAQENSHRAVELSEKLYSEGQSDFMTVLDAQRSLYVTEEAYALSRSRTAVHLISLYKALGGGW